jgi:transcriptional regulator with XRE-family HTH domain
VKTYDERFAWIFEARGTNPSALSEAAGLSRAYIKNLIKSEKEGREIRPGAAALDKIARTANVSFLWLTKNQGPREPYGAVFTAEPTHDPATDSPPPPPISDTYASDDRIDALFEEAAIPGVHTRGDERLVRQVVHRHSNLLKEGTTPVEYVRKLLDTAAKCREAGRKVAPDELYDETFKIVADELVVANRQLREAQARLDAMMAEARIEAARLGVELRTDGDGTPHPALATGIAAAKAKRRQQ